MRFKMTHVVTTKGTHWPAMERDGHTVVDLRMVGPDNKSRFYPVKLRKLNISRAWIKMAELSEPKGFAAIT